MVKAGRPPEFLRRVHNRPVVRRRGRILVLLQLLSVPAGVALGGLLAYAAEHAIRETDLFRLREVRLEEVPGALRPTVRQRLAPLLGRNLLTTDLRPWREGLEELPLVRRAHLRRLLPHALHVRVEPPSPWGVIDADDGPFLVTAEGVLLGAAGDDARDLPHLRVPGLQLAPAREGAPVAAVAPPAGGMAAAVRLFAWLRAHAAALPGPAERVTLSADGLRVRLAQPPLTVVVGDATRLDEQADALAIWLEAGPPAAAAVDLRFRGMVVVRDPSADALAAARE